MTKFDDILTLMEADAVLTDEQLQCLENDTEFRAAAEDIVLAGHTLASAPSDEEISQRLAQFHKNHPKDQIVEEGKTESGKSNIKVIPVWLAIGIAAVFAGLIWVLNKPTDNDPSLLYERDADAIASITDAEGNQLPMHSHLNGGVDPVIIASEYSNASTDGAVSEQQDKDTLMLSLSKGQSYRVDLPDGSRVFLHPGSRLHYPVVFGNRSRDVRLEGEAYFVVAKDRKRPFHVITNRTITEVLGTEFNLCSREGTDERLVLVNGHVSFMSFENEAPINVYPGQSATLDKSGYISVEQADTMEYASWRDGFIYYDRTTLNDILKQISSTYNVSVHCYNRSLLGLHMHFVLRRDQNIKDAVRMLNSMKKVHASLNGNILTVK